MQNVPKSVKITVFPPFAPVHEDCVVTPPSADLTPLNTPTFIETNATLAQFAFPAFPKTNVEVQLWIEAHAPGVFRLRCAPVAQLRPEKPSARSQWRAQQLLAREEAVGELAITSSVDGTGWHIAQGDVVLEVRRDPFCLVLRRAQSIVWQSVADATLSYAADGACWMFNAALAADDAIHGLGQTLDDLCRNGVRLASDDAADRMLPLAWSTKGWGLYCNTFARQVHDVGATQSAYAVQIHDAVLDVFLFAGEPTEILNQYSALTGRVAQPGLWPMGVWLDQAPGQTLDETLGMVEQMRAGKFSVDVLRLAMPAAYGFQADKPVFAWQTEHAPDGDAAFARLSALRLQLTAPCFPGVLQGTELFQEWEDRAWLLMDDATGQAHVFPGCPASAGKPFGALDLTHKDAYKLWTERQRQWVDEGLGAPVCDAQFDIPDSVTARGGESGMALRALYPLLARQALFEAVSTHKTPPEGVVPSADLCPSAQRFVWQTAPVVSNDWAGAAQSLRAALALGNSGIVAQAHSLGSASQPAPSVSPEFYVRCLAMQVFSANFSFQASQNLLPMAFDQDTQALVRHWLHWRYRLIPYVLGIIEDAVRTGMPVQRAMALAFPDDPLAHAWDTQYLLGPALLIAPVLHPGAQATVYLPRGDAWWDLRTGWRYEGGTTLTMDVGLDALPVFGREGHMLCLGLPAQHTDEFNTARLLDEVWMFGMPEHSPVVMRNKIRVMQMQGSSYIKGLEGLRILPSEGLEVKRRGAEVRISRAR